MNCKICNYNNRSNASFCANCGQALAIDNLQSGATGGTLSLKTGQSKYINSIYTPTQGAWIFFKAIGFVMGLQILAGFVVAFFAVGADVSDATDLLQNMSVQLIIMFFMQVAFFVAVWSSGSRPLGLIRHRLYLNYRLVLLGVAMWAVAFVAFLSTNVYFGAFLEHIGYESSGLVMDTVGDRILGAIVIVLVAPICEELVFRFGLLEGLRESGYVKAILFSSLAFALMHMNPEQTFYQFLLGVVCGIAVYKSKSILMGSIIHACNNLFSLFVQDWVWFNDTLVDLFNQGWFVIVAIALFVLGGLVIVQLGKLCSKYGNPHVEPALSNPRVSYHSQSTAVLVYSITLAFCIGMWVLAFVLAVF
ncbi:MAG: CPBP family intramembrane metalloprotease [Clostridiales bacterium]|jgi:membrane protease YdiL (CAAX protease family)|nr:CPBP family intramembrane metalloprotease [Clostridiales bacterium]